jgi:hypothetical protein
MPKITYPWRSLSIGYELRNPAAADAAAIARLKLAGETLQRRLRSDFASEFRLRWSTGDETVLTDTGKASSGEAWVAHVLTEELNGARTAELGPFDVRDEHVLRWRSGEQGTRTGDWPGTTCKLIENRWINGRSFELVPPPPEWGVTDEMLLFVTMEWPCPGPGRDAQSGLAGNGGGGDRPSGDQRSGGSKSG